MMFPYHSPLVQFNASTPKAMATNTSCHVSQPPVDSAVCPSLSENVMQCTNGCPKNGRKKKTQCSAMWIGLHDRKWLGLCL